MKRGHLLWAEMGLGSKEILLQDIFNDYWTSKSHEFLVRGQSGSTTMPLIADQGAQWTLTLENIVAFWNYNSLQKLPFVSFATAHHDLLIMFSYRRNLYASRSRNSKEC